MSGIGNKLRSIWNSLSRGDPEYGHQAPADPASIRPAATGMEAEGAVVEPMPEPSHQPKEYDTDPEKIAEVTEHAIQEPVEPGAYGPPAVLTEKTAGSSAVTETTHGSPGISPDPGDSPPTTPLDASNSSPAVSPDPSNNPTATSAEKSEDSPTGSAENHDNT